MNRRLLFITLLILATVTGVAYYVVGYAQSKLIEFQAVNLAEAVARLATVARSVYTADVTEKLIRNRPGPEVGFEHQKDFVPLPSQFLKHIGQEARIDSVNLYQLRPTSKWNLEPAQNLSDEFLRWAWAQLEKQDQAAPAGPIAWQPVWRVEEVQNTKILRYLWADPASAQSCVDCHNYHESKPDIQARRLAAGVVPGKQWKRHQLLGALEIQIPVSKVEQLAAEQTRVTVLFIIVTLFALLALSVWLLFRDVAQKKDLSELSWQARHDALTGLSNRRDLERALDRLWRMETPPNTQHALCLLDLDQFKPINDRFGHEAGDALLRAIAVALAGKVRASDMVARLGGDEFAVVLPACPIDQARELAQGLCEAVRTLDWRMQNERVHLSASIGVVMINAREIDSLAQLLRAADRACYAAKKAGGNSIHFGSVDEPNRA